MESLVADGATVPTQEPGSRQVPESGEVSVRMSGAEMPQGDLASIPAGGLQVMLDLAEGMVGIFEFHVHGKFLFESERDSLPERLVCGHSVPFPADL